MHALEPAMACRADAGNDDPRDLTGLQHSGRAARGVSRLNWLGAAALVLVFAGVGTAWGQAAVEYGGATATMGAVGAGVRPTDVLTSPAGVGPDEVTLPVHSGPPPDVVNRRALEQQAGNVAAKLLLRSAPSNARVWMDGKFVGRTPLLLLVPPGKHQVEMRGDRQEHGEAQLSFLAHETRDVELSLAERYPTSISLAGTR